MDEQIGRLLDAVEEQGLADNTVILFTADNGMSMGQHGVWGKGNGTFPMNMYDSAVKVPFLISWPGHIPANTVCSEMISACDLLPTILKLTGLSDKQPVGFPGRSFTELLKGRMEKWFCTYSDPAIDGVRSAVNGSGQLCRPGVYAIYEDPFAPKGVE